MPRTKKKVEEQPLKKFFVSLCYSIPINYEGYIMAVDEDDAVRRADELDGELADEPFWGEEEPDYKLDLKHPSRSVGVYVEESEE